MLLRRRERLHVVIAALGDPSKPYGEGVPFPEEWEKPYRDRPKVEMLVKPTDTLGAALRAAMHELGVAPPSFLESEDIPTFGPSFVAFYTPEDKERFTGPFQSSVPILDAAGRVLLNAYNFDEITFAELIEAADETALRGDPLRPWLILHFEVGNGLFADWGTVANLWDLAWYVLDHVDTLLGAAGGAYAIKHAIVDRLRSRTKGGRDAAARRGPQWMQEQGASPWVLATFLWQVPRTTDQVAGLLGCTAGEAEAVLWAFGLVPDPNTGLWQPGEDEEAKMLRGNLELIVHSYNEAVIAESINLRVEHLLDTGETPPVLWPRDPGCEEPEEH